jgi:hypothetical protein
LRVSGCRPNCRLALSIETNFADGIARGVFAHEVRFAGDDIKVIDWASIDRLLARAVETGRMWVNTYNQLPEKAPFGGYKKSGIGRETYKSILDNYSEVKNIFIDIDDVPSGFYPAPSQ